MDPQQLQTKQGIVIRKNVGQFEVLSGDQKISCVLSPRMTAGNNRTEQGRPIHEKFNSNRHSEQVTVGDIVSFVELENHAGQIYSIQPRHNHFSRRAVSSKDGGQRSEQVVVANVDQVIPVMSAGQPAPSWNMLDRYLVMAEADELSAVICINKVDLIDPGDAEFCKVVDEYRQIGYFVLLVSAQTGQGVDELKALLKGNLSVFLGKSGVGKTSLLNALQPGLGQRVNEVSRGGLRRGKHTTTSFEMFPLDFGGSIVDTPGIRKLGLWNIEESELADYFPEMRPLVGSCRFGLDCRHNEEPGCMIRKAVMAGRISPRRYKSYMRMKEDL